MPKYYRNTSIAIIYKSHIVLLGTLRQGDVIVVLWMQQLYDTESLKCSQPLMCLLQHQFMERVILAHTLEGRGRRGRRGEKREKREKRERGRGKRERAGGEKRERGEEGER